MSVVPVHFGIAGWSYADWRGIVYPKGCKDTLRHVASLVDFIEINSTFYRTPAPSVVESWARRVADLPTFFTAKLPRDVTHDGRLDAGLADAVRASLRPLREAGRLRALLAQFSYRFEAGRDQLAYLRRIAATFDDLAPLAVEVRHASWRNREHLDELRPLGVSVVHLDYPGSTSGFDGAGTALFGQSGIAYLRLHGRNRRAWFSKESGRDEVYDWLYSPRERSEIERRVALLTDAASTAALVVANNHFQGKAVKLVLELIAAHHGRRVRVPQELLAAYPDLRAIAARVQRGLFDSGPVEGGPSEGGPGEGDPGEGGTGSRDG